MSENKPSEGRPQGAGVSSPMAMGMSMAKRMMGPMGRGEANPAIEQMMGMCSEMLNAIRETNALAVHATPELDQIFTDWLEGLEAKAEEMITKGETDGAALASALGVTEASANYLLYRLATADKVTLRAKVRT